MANKIRCDRCKQLVNATILDGFTSGCYKVEGYWGKFADAKPWEKIICDKCMWKCPKYIKVYGRH